MKPARKALKGDGEEGFPGAHAGYYNEWDLSVSPIGYKSSRYGLSLDRKSSGIRVDYTSFWFAINFGTSRTDMQVISFVKSVQFRFLVVERSTRMLLYNKNLSLIGFVSKIACVQTFPIYFVFRVQQRK